jgi:hypothetical protein
MEPITMGLIAGGANLLGGVLGKIFSKGDRKKAEELANQAFSEIDSIGLPPNEAIPLLLEKFKSAGIYTPELETEIKQQVSKVAGIKEDSSLKDAQRMALETLQKTGRTGLSAQDRAAYNKLRQESQRDSEAKRQQIIQNMQARGQAGGGAELAASLMSSQAAADQQAAMGDELAGAASQRALQAIMNAGQLGGSMRGQDLDYNKTVAEAQDEMERFNVQNAINRQQRNVGSKNQAQAGNLDREQAIMNANTQMGNQEQLRQSQARQNYYQDLANRAKMRGEARMGQANLKAGKAQQTAQTFSGIGSGVAAGVGAAANYMNAPKTPATMASHAIPEETPDEFYMRKGYKL